jgi:hypothetical protein
MKKLRKKRRRMRTRSGNLTVTLKWQMAMLTLTGRLTQTRTRMVRQTLTWTLMPKPILMRMARLTRKVSWT